MHPRTAARLLVCTVSLSCGPKIDRGPVPIERALGEVALVLPAPTDGPNIYLAAMIGAGSAYDPIGREGIAALTAGSLVEAGAGPRSPQEVRDALFPTGNAFEVVVDREWVSVRLRCHQEQAPLCVALFADALVSPRFAEDEVARLRELAIRDLTEGALANEEWLGREAFETAVYEGHPYGHPPEGRTGVLPLLDPAGLRAFHASHYVRENIVVGMAGRVDPALVEDMRTRLLKLPGPLPPRLALYQPVQPTGLSLVAIDTDTPVTGFHFGHPLALGRSHADYPAMLVAITALGAHRQSYGRLFRAMREERGLNYGDYAYIEPYLERSRTSTADQGVLRDQNRFMVWVRPTSIENGPFALKLALDEVERWVAEGLAPDEFERIRSSLVAGLPLLATDPGRRMLFALEARAAGAPDLLQTLPNALQGLTVEATNEAIKRHIKPDKLRVIAVSGEADSLVAALSKADATPIVYAEGAADPLRAARDEAVAKRALELVATSVVAADGVFR